MRDKIRMNSSAGTGHFYTTDKNKRTTPDKLEMKKYDPVARKHVMYKEGKIKEARCVCRLIENAGYSRGFFWLQAD